MRLVHSQVTINALPKNSCFLLSAFCFTVTLSPSEIQSHCVVHKCTSLCSLFQTALCSLFPPQAAVARLPKVLSYFLLQFVIAVTASDGDYYMSNFRPRQCGLFIVILSSTLSLKTVVFFYLLFVLRLLSPPSEIQSPCVVHKCTSLCSLFQTALCSLFPPQAAVARLPQVPSYFLLQFVIAVTCK